MKLYDVRGKRMRRTEMFFGVLAGTIGLLLGVLSLVGILPYAAAAISTHAVVGICANAAGIIGAVLVQRHHFAGSGIMAAVMVAIMCFGFPWQSIPAVMYIIAVVLAVVPVRIHTEDDKGRMES